ncbi:MAG: cobalamin biosynthesis protein [Stomatobaculum sp.]|nr:cobalamin biosynthesis protein [Stomatobaculum sp.]
MKIIRIISFTDAGYALAGHLCSAFSLRGENAEAVLCSRETGVSLRDWTEESFRKGRVLIFIGACGIAVRSIAPHIRNKTEDPAVLVLDEKGAFCIPVLSGHLGEANRYAVLAAEITGGVPVLTTATDVNGLFAVDVFASENGMIISSMEEAKRFSAALLKKGRGTLVIPSAFSKEIRTEGTLPPEISVADASFGNAPEFLVSPELSASICAVSGVSSPYRPLQLIPRCLILGIGCRKGRKAEQLQEFVKSVFTAGGLDLRAVRCIASVDMKKEEPGLVRLAELFHVPFVTCSPEKLMAQEGEFASSDFVSRTTGADNICERAAAAAGASRILIRKTARDGMTAAVGIAETVLRFPGRSAADTARGVAADGEERRGLECGF